METLLQILQTHALLLAALLGPAVRVAGHWLPEEPLMIAMGALASHSSRPEAALLLCLLWASHAVTDYAVYLIGRRIAPHLARWPKAERRVMAVVDRIGTSPWALAALVPIRVLPLGRGAWLAGFGVAGVRRTSFAVADAVAVAAHVLVWCGLGWWLGSQAAVAVSVAWPATLWIMVAACSATAGVVVWRWVTRRWVGAFALARSRQPLA